MHKLSTVIMTFNEEENIERCIQSVSHIADEVLVIDSFSTDQTVEIAESLGAAILKHEFEGYIEQRTICVANAKHDFILALDADEWLSEELQKEILELKNSKQGNAFSLNRLSRIGKHWIHHGTWHPQYILRLFMRDQIICSGKSPHDKIIPKNDVSVFKLKGKLFHQVNEDYFDRVTTINKHSSIAANTLQKENKRPSILRLVFKPLYRFINEYFFHLGLLDGRNGFFVCITAAYYVFLREMKLYELKENAN